MNMFHVCYLRYGTQNSVTLNITAIDENDVRKQLREMFPNDKFPPMVMVMGHTCENAQAHSVILASGRMTPLT